MMFLHLSTPVRLWHNLLTLSGKMPEMAEVQPRWELKKEIAKTGRMVLDVPRRKVEKRSVRKLMEEVDDNIRCHHMTIERWEEWKMPYVLEMMAVQCWPFNAGVVTSQLDRSVICYLVYSAKHDDYMPIHLTVI